MTFTQRNDGYVYDSETERVYATQIGLARLCGVNDSSIRHLRSSQGWEVKETQVLTDNGFRSSQLFSSSQCKDAIKHFAKKGNEVAEKALDEMLEAGIVTYMEQLAGVSIPSQQVQAAYERTLARERNINLALNVQGRQAIGRGNMLQVNKKAAIDTFGMTVTQRTDGKYPARKYVQLGELSLLNDSTANRIIG